MSENSAKIQTETIPSSNFPKQRYTGSPTHGFDADNDSELIMGSVFGLRGWNQDALGRLVPVSYNSAGAFKPGVNVASCSISQYDRYRLDSTGKITKKSAGKDESTLRNHSMAKCSCGYYAYFDESSSESRHGTVGGIVEGTGLAVLGDKGFRVEKAELKALILRGEKPGHRVGFWSWLAKWVLPTNRRLQKSNHFGRHHSRDAMFGWFGTLLVVSGLSTLGFSIASIITEVQNSQSLSVLWLPQLFSLFMVFFAVSWLNIIEGFPEGNKSSYLASTRGGPREVKLFKRNLNKDLGDPNDPYSAARLAKLYPGVPIYSSISAARKDFALTKLSDFVTSPTELPTPETADDFWNLHDDEY